MIVSDESRAAKYAARGGNDAATASAGPMQTNEDEEEGQLTQMLEENMREDEGADAGEPEDIDMNNEEGDEDGNAPRRRRKLRITRNDADDAMKDKSDVKKSNGGGSC